jgi:hypothetical protein
LEKVIVVVMVGRMQVPLRLLLLLVTVGRMQVPLPLPLPLLLLLLLMQVRAMRHPVWIGPWFLCVDFVLPTGQLEWTGCLGQGTVGWCPPVCRWGCPWRLVAGCGFGDEIEDFLDSPPPKSNK